MEREEEVKVDIFKAFEQELGKTISSMELEIMNAWLTTGYSEELILGALREAIYSGVRSFRYIDTILYEWHNKGFKNMNDVNNKFNKALLKINFNPLKLNRFSTAINVGSNSLVLTFTVLYVACISNADAIPLNTIIKIVANNNVVIG